MMIGAANVRDQEKFEDVYFFEKGELDHFLWEN